MRSDRVVLASSLLAALLLSAPAHAGFGSLLKLGKVGSSAGKAGRVAKTASVVTKTARVGRGVAMVSGAVAAERAGLVFAGLGDDAARSAGYLARTADSEFVLVTRAGQRPVAASEVGSTVQQLSREGSATVYLDRSAASSEEVLAALPADAELRLAEGGTSLPVRRQASGEGTDFVVDVASNAVDLQDYLGGDGEEDDADGPPYLVLGLAGVGLLGWWALRRQA